MYDISYMFRHYIAILRERIGVFVGFSRIFLLEILIFKGLTARRLYKSLGVKGLKSDNNNGYLT
jgi:hypothetical protein